MRLILMIAMALMAVGHASADNRQARHMIRQGNKLYRLGDKQAAQVYYFKAVNADSTDARAQYNLATSMFPEQWKVVPEVQRDTMVQTFRKAAELEENPFRKSQAYRNMGVVYQGAKDFKNAIEAYKNALRNNPNDDEARYNLVLCQRQLKNDNQQDQDQNQQGQDKQEQDKQKQEQQKKQDEQKKQEEQQQQQEQQQEPPMSKDNAEQLLNAAMQKEKETQKRMQQQQNGQRRQLEKNW